MHTNAKWTAQKVVGTRQVDFQVVTESGGLICYVNNKAHADRIVRASNSHDALVNALREMANFDCPFDSDIAPVAYANWHKARSAAREAIALAERR